MTAGAGKGGFAMKAIARVVSVGWASLVAVLALIGAPTAASAAIVDYYISGDGTGVINGLDWSGAFTITMVGDNSTVSGDVIDPLESATVTLPGGITATLSIPTRLGINGTSVFFSRSSSNGFDLFDFSLSSADAAAFNFQAGYGPVTGTGVFALNQFQDVATSAGPLSFDSSGDVQFSSSGASAVPEPSTWAMMLIGFAGLGFAGYRRAKNAAKGSSPAVLAATKV